MKPLPTPPNQSDIRNLILAAVLSCGLLFVYQVFYAGPQEAAQRAAFQAQQERAKVAESDVILPSASHVQQRADVVSKLPRKELLQQFPRVKISSPTVHGSLNLKGLRFDDLTLARHRVRLEEDSPEVTLLSPAQAADRYFLQLGWLSAGHNTVVPDDGAVWQADSDTLTPEQPVTLHWKNPQGVEFLVHLALDENYLFTVKQEVHNNSAKPVAVAPYGLINQTLPHEDTNFNAIIHRGPIGVLDGATLTETAYKDLESDGVETFKDARGWLGIADKYWLTAFVPEKGKNFVANFQPVAGKGGASRVQVDYLAPVQDVAAGATVAYGTHIFAGAKELSVLEHYKETLNVPLFDRALDFGILYFLTKPIFMALDYFYHLLGNFGLAILSFVVVLKIALFPLSNKSYRSMAQMRALQPELDKLKKNYGDDKLKMQQEMMALWQREKVNPVSGCLPMLIQIPIFFALYKVLMVTIEMRHAPFYGWVKDLSGADPSNIFTLFGLIPWDAPAMLHIGVWPIIMCVTMVLQQKLNPKPSDPIQAKVISFLPYIFLVLFATFPAGLLIYWAWNNVLSIIQQALILRNFERHKRKRGKAVAA